MDYDDDEDDEDYNPPSRKPGSADSSNKSKRNSPDSQQEKSELSKKPRLGQPNDGEISVVAACQGDLPTQDISAVPLAGDTGGNSNGSSTGKEGAAGENRSSCLSNAVDSRQPSGEECPSIPISNSSQEMAVNNSGAKVAGSEPYPVR